MKVCEACLRPGDEQTCRGILVGPPCARCGEHAATVVVKPSDDGTARAVCPLERRPGVSPLKVRPRRGA